MSTVIVDALLFGKRLQESKISRDFPNSIDHTTDIVHNMADVARVIDEIPQGKRVVFIPGAGFEVGNSLNRSLVLLEKLLDKGVASVKIGGFVIKDVATRAHQLKQRELAKAKQ